jgi:hypothetical protein
VYTLLETMMKSVALVYIYSSSERIRAATHGWWEEERNILVQWINRMSRSLPAFKCTAL